MNKEKVLNLAFFQLVCPSYKVPMFERLQELPQIKLELFVGDKPPPLAPVSGDFSNIKHVALKNYIYTIFGITIVFQNFFKKIDLKNYDFVILPEGVFFLSNYLIMFFCKIKNIPVGLYSHGYNHQRNKSTLSKLLEFVRGIVHRRCDFIIVYSKKGYSHVNINNKVPSEKIFLALNTLDVEDIQKRSDKFSIDDTNKCRQSFGIKPEDFLIAFVGRIEKEKNPLWAIELIQHLLDKTYSPHLFFIGDGSELDIIKNFLRGCPNHVQSRIHFLGRLSVKDVDLYLKSSDVSVMPGMTGLAVVHSFALGVPYITTNIETHSPEIEYLQHNINGVIVENNKESFFNGVEMLANNIPMRKSMGNEAFIFAKDKLSATNQTKAYVELSKFIRTKHYKY